MVGAFVHSEEPRDKQSKGHHLLSNAIDVGDHTKSRSHLGLKSGAIIVRGLGTLQDIALMVRGTSKGELLCQQLPPQQNEGSIIEVLVDSTRVIALVDTHCTTTLLGPKLVCGCGGSRTTVKAVDTTEVKCRGTHQLELLQWNDAKNRGNYH